MKKTFTINLGRQGTNIDDDALESLQQYINALKAPLLQRRRRGRNHVRHRKSVGRIIHRKPETGKPGIRLDPRRGTSHFHHGKTGRHFDEEAPRKLPNNKRLARKDFTQKTVPGPARPHLGRRGLRLATYLGIPVTLTRVCFLLMMFVYGIFFLVYIFMWMLVPKAVTPRQRLQMRGKGINVSNIEDSVREGFQNAREKYATNVAAKPGMPC